MAKPEQINLKNLVAEVINDVQGVLKPAQKIEYFHEGIETAWLDKQMIRNILLNLTSNAIKFSGEGKIIKLHIKISPSEIKINISDQGIGIPKDEYEHLFGRFFRAKNATNIQGTGLGLNIVARYLEMMHGKIDFTSALNEGTTFKITIPNK